MTEQNNNKVNPNVKGEINMSKDQLVAQAREALKVLLNGGNVVDDVKMEAVLRSLVADAGSVRGKKDRSTIFATSTDIGQLRKEIKSAYGGKCKAKGKPESIKEYEAQIRDGQARITELYVVARESGRFIEKLIEFNEHTTTILQVIVEDIEDKLNVTLAAYSKAGRKREANKCKATTPDGIKTIIEGYLGAAGLEAYESRVTNLDMRVITLNRLYRLATEGPVEKQA